MILIDVQYLQNFVLIFEKPSNGQNSFLLGFITPNKKDPPLPPRHSLPTWEGISLHLNFYLETPEVLWEFQGLIKKEVEFPEVITKK